MHADIPVQRVNSVNFCFYHVEEIRSLSVKEITNAQTFDSLSHPTSGGLHDAALGPCNRDEVCGTCGQNYIHCPGHMGHVQLPLPVYNPVYFKTLFQILRGSCFSCHRLAVQPILAYVLVQKMLLLDKGLLSAAEELEAYVSHLKMELGTDAAAEDSIRHSVQEFLSSIPKDEDSSREEVSVKNIQALKNREISIFISQNFMNQSIKCPHCKKRKRQLRQENNVKLLLGAPKGSAVDQKPKDMKRQKKSKEGSEEEDDDVNMEPQTSLMDMENEELEESVNFDSKNKSYITPTQARDHLRLVWSADHVLMQCLFRSLSSDQAADIFFLEVMPVPPTRFRPISVMKGLKYEHSQTANLSRVLQGCSRIRQILDFVNQKKEDNIPPGVLSEVPGKTLIEKLNNSWDQLQTYVNCIVDSDLDKLSTDKHQGIKQILEKKEGLFRKHMMGKRVDFAARSVISPDPCINTNEIGVPEVFAKKLTYPQPVTPWNIKELRQAVINGPAVHPGACFVLNEDGTKVMLSATEKTLREAVAKQLLTPSSNPLAFRECKKVYRHLKNGDIMLLNRQPTLHKPSIQAHKVRVLPGQKTLRLHYANCKAYNADFDGDEMNAHFPQNELARAEAYTIVSTDFQYLVPKDGTPLAGLIQDHMVSGVQLTIRGRFFNRQDYCKLVYTALVDKPDRIRTIPPSIIKPYPMWSGKQVLSTILINTIPSNKKPLNLIGKSKIPEKSWNTVTDTSVRYGMPKFLIEEMGESRVVIRGGELLCGVLDKGHYGNTPYGLVHCCYELYGGNVAGQVLTCFGRIFMNFLQMIRGFSLGVEDIIVTEEADIERQKAVEESRICGDESAAEALGLKDSTDVMTMIDGLKKAHFSTDDRQMRELDLSMKSRTDEIQNSIVRSCMPKGLLRVFPRNNLQLMVQSGAKGSSVNCMQISCLLGQIELEGRRPPPMLSGKTLPSFLAYDTSPRAGGFVCGRFLTGIRPQEYFFHCMAGREGLIDTAVKTSRSGYLQRCLIKHLEGIIVNYDLTVRDSDGSIVQFYYGEDGMDICKSGFMKSKMFPFLLENQDVVRNKLQTSTDGQLPDNKTVRKWNKKVAKFQKKELSVRQHNQRKNGFLNFCKKSSLPGSDDHTMSKYGRTKSACVKCEAWRALDDKAKLKFSKKAARCLDPVTSHFRPFQHQGVLPENLADTLQEFSKKDLPHLPERDSMSEKDFKTLMNEKFLASVAEPGESVGLLCAQSIGEPSTQMTLNTFHFAGRGEMNVTLGIPRLREILMVASDNIKTPSMQIPITSPDAKAGAKCIQSLFTKVSLSEVLENVEIDEYLAIKNVLKANKSRMFQLRFTFIPFGLYKDRFCVTPAIILEYMERVYFRRLIAVIKKKMQALSKARLVSSGRVFNQLIAEQKDKPGKESSPDNEDDGENSAAEDLGADDDAVADKAVRRHEEEQEYDEEAEGDWLEKSVDTETVSMDNDENSDDDDEYSSFVTQESGIGVLGSPKNRKKMVEERINYVLSVSDKIVKYKFDTKKQQWCEITLQYGIMDSKMDLGSLIDADAKLAIVHEVPGINQCFFTEKQGPSGKQLSLTTDGINISEVYKYADILNVNELYSNDIHAIAKTYGIEAAAKVITMEIKNVFAAYGIEVDYRHLSLLADYMTFEGSYKPFNRKAMETSSSPLQKMTFETTMNFLVNASIHGNKDKLCNPSSQLVVGRVVSCGSGIFEILQPLC